MRLTPNLPRHSCFRETTYSIPCKRALTMVKSPWLAPRGASLSCETRLGVELCYFLLPVVRLAPLCRLDCFHHCPCLSICGKIFLSAAIPLKAGGDEPDRALSAMLHVHCCHGPTLHISHLHLMLGRLDGWKSVKLSCTIHPLPEQ